MLGPLGHHPDSYTAAEAARAADEDVGGVFAEEGGGLFGTRGLGCGLVGGEEEKEGWMAYGDMVVVFEDYDASSIAVRCCDASQRGGYF